MSNIIMPSVTFLTSSVYRYHNVNAFDMDDGWLDGPTRIAIQIPCCLTDKAIAALGLITLNFASYRHLQNEYGEG